MGFWKTFFGGEANPDEEKKSADERNFDLLKYDGVKAMRMGQFDYAVKCFTMALLTKDDPEVHDYLSRAYLQTGRLDDSLSELHKLMAHDPDNVNVVLQAASVAFVKEDYDTMSQLCQQAIGMDGTNALAHLFYAKAAVGQGDLVQGIARMTKSIALDESMGDARLLRAQTLMKMGDLEAAADDVEWLCAHTEDNEDVLLLQARLEAARGNSELAIGIYGHVVDVNPFCADAFRERGKLRLEQGDKQGAEEDMKMVLELNPQEMTDVSGEYSAEGIEQKVKQQYSNLNPFGI